MLRRPITFDEKVDARFTKGPQSACWWWEGSLKEGRPALGLRHVMRYIYQREIAPIPPGMVLVRADHTADCRPHERCRHWRCVNPWHVRLVPSHRGLYEREVTHELESSERTAIWKRRVRAARGKQERSDDTAEAGTENP